MLTATLKALSFKSAVFGRFKSWIVQTSCLKPHPVTMICQACFWLSETRTVRGNENHILQFLDVIIASYWYYSYKVETMRRISFDYLSFLSIRLLNFKESDCRRKKPQFQFSVLHVEDSCSLGLVLFLTRPVIINCICMLYYCVVVVDAVSDC